MTTPVAINTAVAASNTDLYTAGSAKAHVVSLVLTNTTSGDLTIDVWKRNAADSTSWFIAKTLTVPALSSKTFRGGLIVFSASGEKLRAIASGVGIDAVGAVNEY